MQRLKTKKEEKYLNRLAARVIRRQNKYFRRNVHINHETTYLKILRIKNYKQFDSEIGGYKELPKGVCFFFYHLRSNALFPRLFNVSDSEYIITDSKTNRILTINNKLKEYPDFVNVWIVKKNTVEFFKLQIGDIFFTR